MLNDDAITKKIIFKKTFMSIDLKILLSSASTTFKPIIKKKIKCRC